jgi:hypothetical protein
VVKVDGVVSAMKRHLLPVSHVRDVDQCGAMKYDETTMKSMCKSYNNVLNDALLL